MAKSVRGAKTARRGTTSATKAKVKPAGRARTRAKVPTKAKPRVAKSAGSNVGLARPLRLKANLSN
jgi:hypothetical protein